MTRIMIFLVVAVFLFGGAAGVSWYLQNQPPSADNAKEGDEKSPKTSAKAVTPKKTAESKLPASQIDNPDARKAAAASATLQVREEEIKRREESLSESPASTIVQTTEATEYSTMRSPIPVAETAALRDARPEPRHPPGHLPRSVSVS